MEELSYFSKVDCAPGDLVAITIKRRRELALVIKVSTVLEERQTLRQASFTVRRISGKVSDGFLSKNMMESLSTIASILLLPLPKLLNDLLPVKLLAKESVPAFPSDREQKADNEVYALGLPKEERVTRYKSLIREYFAKKSSVVIFVPTLNHIEEFRNVLSKGIEDYLVIHHGSQGIKESATTLKTLLKESHPLLIISTPSLLPFLRSDVGVVIIEKESSAHYATFGDLSYDMKYVLAELARRNDKQLIFGATLLSVEMYHAVQQKRIRALVPLHLRNDTGVRVIQMDKDTYAATPYLSHATYALLKEAYTERRGHHLIYAQRKGMYPTTICADCGTLLTCTKCDTPLILHQIGLTRTYVCHQCEDITRVDEETSITCKHCSSWRMRLLGVAVSGLEQSILPIGLQTFVIDGEHTPTKEKAKKVYADWQMSPCGVLIGTEMALNLAQTSDSITIASLDSLFSLPEYKTDERIVSLIVDASEKTSGPIILQTRREKSPIIDLLRAHSFTQYYEQLLRDRIASKLPPEYTLIKVVFENCGDTERKKVEEKLADEETTWYELGGGKTLLIIHIPQHMWETEQKRRTKIASLTHGKHVQVNPITLFS